ncbi:hypothetical protein [Chitinophaga pinensis]|uniref:hypothetical protein n=1 Tax=Chitinophaga pinensis TaxID=79329 RepID=UPI001C99CF7F|nr:hypothetical protein [Chitinophaga pinensis]
MKTFLMHRLLMLVFLLAVCGRLSAQQPLEKVLTFKGSTITVQQFIQQVKSQQQLQFTFDEDVNALLSRTVHIRKNTVSLKEALDWLAADASIHCRILNNYAILSVAPAPQKTPASANTGSPELPQPSTKALGEVVVTALGIKKMNVTSVIQ